MSTSANMGGSEIKGASKNGHFDFIQRRLHVDFAWTRGRRAHR